MFKQTIFAVIIFSYGAYAMEKNEKEQCVLDIFKYETAKKLLTQKISKDIRTFNEISPKYFALKACNNPEKCEGYYFPHDMVISEGMALSGNFCCIKNPHQQYTIGHFANTSNMNTSDFTCLRNLILAGLKVKPFVIKNEMQQELYFYSILKIGDLEFQPIKSNYVEITNKQEDL